MGSLPPLLHLLGQEILHYEGNRHMRCNSHIEGHVAHPEVSESLVFNGLAHGIEDVLVWEVSLGIWLHLLQLGLGIVEWETGEGGGKS